MPDDMSHAKARGATPDVIRAALAGERLQRHAVWRVPSDHPEADRLDQLSAGGYLDSRLYANACAALRLWLDSGLGRSHGVAAYLRTCRTSGDGDADQMTAEDVARDLIETGGVDIQAVIMLVRGDAMGAYMWGRALRGLDGLDWLAARYDGERWRGEKT